MFGHAKPAITKRDSLSLMVDKAMALRLSYVLDREFASGTATGSGEMSFLVRASRQRPGQASLASRWWTNS